MIRATIAGGGVLPHIHKVRPFSARRSWGSLACAAGEGSDAEFVLF
jgi:hypothetical protein